MIKLFIVSREGGAIGHFLTEKLAGAFAMECHKIAPQDHMRCTITESYISTYGMNVERSRDLISSVNKSVADI